MHLLLDQRDIDQSKRSMYPGLHCKSYNEDDQPNLLNLNMFKLSTYPFSLLPTSNLDLSFSTWDFNNNNKRPKTSSNPVQVPVAEAQHNEPTINGARKLRFRDHIGTYKQRFWATEAVDASINIENYDSGDGTNGMQLVQQLISCAEAVACRDRAQASILLTELRAKAMVFGTSFQRVASCFVQGLVDRLMLVQPIGACGSRVAAAATTTTTVEWDEALSLVYDACPYIQFGHFVANSAILEAFEGESLVHIVDLGMTLGLAHGHQWRKLLQSLASRSPALRRVRITAVGSNTDRLIIIGTELESYAHTLNINLEFSVIATNLENLKPEQINIREGEVLAVNSILQLHCVVKESRGALNTVLQMIHELAPRVLVLVEQDSSHNGPFFLGRFMEALHYYSAIFDSLDVMMPKYDTKRAKMEQFYFGEEIKNIVSCEGGGRVERHERVDQWRRRMSRAGFQPAPVKVVAEVKEWLVKVVSCEGFTVGEEKGCLVLGWKSKPVIAASCWKC